MLVLRRVPARWGCEGLGGNQICTRARSKAIPIGFPLGFKGHWCLRPRFDKPITRYYSDGESCTSASTVMLNSLEISGEESGLPFFGNRSAARRLDVHFRKLCTYSLTERGRFDSSCLSIHLTSTTSNQCRSGS